MAASMMMHGLCLQAFSRTNTSVLRKLCYTPSIYHAVRNFLSDAYLCNEEWKSRLNEPVIKKVNTGTLFYELDRRLNHKKPVSFVDVNIFANAVTSKDELEELEDIVHRFRRTPATGDADESFSHAVIRTFLDFDANDALIRILNDRMNYGIFHDCYTASMMMDHFLEAKNYRDAAKVATFMMLQEDFDHPIASRLALYSCNMYLQHPEPAPWDPEPEVEKVEEDEDEEEVVIRMQYLINPYSENHFDLRDPKLLVGKTLVLLTKDSKDAVGLTSQLIGLTLFEKWDKLTKLLQSIKDDSNAVLMKDGVEMFKKFLAEYCEKEDAPKDHDKPFLSAISDLEKSGKLKDGVMVDVISERVKEAVKSHEAEDILKLKEMYQQWARNRQELIQKQIEEFNRNSRIDVILQKKAEIKKKEEELFFFENIEKHRLNIPPKEEDLMITEDGKLSQESLLDVPPEIVGLTGRYSKGIIEQHEPWWRWEEHKGDKKRHPIKDIPRFRGYPIYPRKD